MQSIMLRSFIAVTLCLANSSAFSEDAGKNDFMAYCSSCHGVDGKGKGPMYLSTPSKPTDLTLLAQSNGGYFPYIKVRRIIDGRVEKGNSNVAHMKGKMPVWGEVFTADKSNTAAGEIHSDAIAKMRILNIVDYLASIQQQCVGECE